MDDNRSVASTSISAHVDGRTVSAAINIGIGWLAANGTIIGSYSFHTYVHEIGHAVGLGLSGQSGVECRRVQDRTLSA